MQHIRLMVLVLLMLLAACSRRWEERMLDVGVFSVVGHWIETEYWMLERRSGIEYTEICNGLTHECYVSGSADKLSERNANIDISGTGKYVAVYSNNINRKMLDRPVFLIFDSSAGKKLGCAGDKLSENMMDVNYVWQGDVGLGMEYGVNHKALFLLYFGKGVCNISMIKRYPLNVNLGRRHYNPASSELAWGVCDSDCELVVVNVATKKERSYPIARCTELPPAGYAKWIEGRLTHHCPGEEKRFF